MFQKYPSAAKSNKVGTYPALVNSGGGYFYDEVLEYRVLVHPKTSKDAYFHAFVSYKKALDFSKRISGAADPLVLVLQKEHINEPKPDIFEHIKEERITEWQVDWLKGSKRTKDSILKFLQKHK